MPNLREAATQALEAMEKATRFMSDSDYRKLNQAIDALKAALAEPVQEPQRKPRHVSYVCPQCHWSLDERKPLTEEEIALIVADCAASAHRHDDFSFARAIERAHGIT